MVLLRVFELFLALAVVYLLVTEVVIPLWRGTVLFPRFRSKETKLERELADAKQLGIETGLEVRIGREKEKFAKKPKQADVNNPDSANPVIN